MLPAYSGARSGQRASASQPVRGRRGARQAGGRRGVPHARRRTRTSRTLHTAPSSRGASETASRRNSRLEQKPPQPRRHRHRHHRSASEMELHPPTTPRPSRNRRLIAYRRILIETERVNNILLRNIFFEHQTASRGFICLSILFIISSNNQGITFYLSRT